MRLRNPRPDRLGVRVRHATRFGCDAHDRPGTPRGCGADAIRDGETVQRLVQPAEARARTICLARKPLDGNLAHNLLGHGTGALHIDACRVPFRNTADEAESKGKNQHGRFDSGPRDNHVYGADKANRTDYTAAARFTPNMLFDQSTAKELDRQSGVTVSRKGKPRASTKPGDGWGMTHTGAEYDDMGGASRFYPVFRYCPKASSAERPKVDGILHPTVKPVELMRWLVRLITPEGGLVLEPFAGSGTTLEACLLEHMQCTASELDPDYIKLIHARLSKPIQNELF